MAKTVEKIDREALEKAIQSDEELIEELELEKPKGSSKLAKRIGIVLFVILNAVVLYFIAKDALSKEPPPVEPFSFANILFLLGGLMCLAVVLGCETFKYILMMRHLGEKVSVRPAFATAALGKYYDWSLPPEYKRGLLAGMKPEWSMSSDIYYLMINFYEQVTGHRPEVNFQLNNRATHKLMRCLDIGDKEKKAIAHLFIKCTEISEPKRIRNASELINTEAFRYLIEKNPNC